MESSQDMERIGEASKRADEEEIDVDALYDEHEEDKEEGSEEDDMDDSNEENNGKNNVYSSSRKGGSRKRRKEIKRSGKALVEKLISTLRNEKMAPEILPYASDLVMELTSRVEDRQDMIDETEEAFDAIIYQMEADRIKYVLTAYLRTRIRKIQRFVFHVTSSSEFLNRLSPAEYKFAKNFLDLLGKHFDKSVLQLIPKRFRNLDEAAKAMPRPNLDNFVFCNVNRDIGEISLGGLTNQIVDLVQGDTYILKYRDIRSFVEDGSVRLV